MLGHNVECIFFFFFTGRPSQKCLKATVLEDVVQVVIVLQEKSGSYRSALQGFRPIKMDMSGGKDFLDILNS